LSLILFELLLVFAGSGLGRIIGGGCGFKYLGEGVAITVVDRGKGESVYAE